MPENCLTMMYGLMYLYIRIEDQQLNFKMGKITRESKFMHLIFVLIQKFKLGL